MCLLIGILWAKLSYLAKLRRKNKPLFQSGNNLLLRPGMFHNTSNFAVDETEVLSRIDTIFIELGFRSL